MDITPQELFIGVAVSAIWFVILFAVIRAGVAAGNKEVVDQLKELNKKA